MKMQRWQIEFFDAKYDRYGGHSQWAARLLNLDYVVVGFAGPWSMHYYHTYCDGQHHCIAIGWFFVSWGGRPYHDIDGY